MALAQPLRAEPSHLLHDLHDLRGRARTQPTLAGQRNLPVVPPLASLLPEGLRRGSTVAVASSHDLALALVAGPSATGSWVATVNIPTLGVAAAAEAGVALERLALVPWAPPGQWAVVVAALLDGLDVVLTTPPPHVRTAHARRLVARARERGSVLVVVGSRPWEGSDLTLSVLDRRWEGMGRGHGHLAGCTAEVAVGGRRAPRERRARVLLPAGGGAVPGA